MAEYDPEDGEKKEAKRSDTWRSKIVCQLFAIVDALKPSSELTNRTMKSRTSTARFRRSSTSPHAAARTQEAREAGMSVWNVGNLNGGFSRFWFVLTSLQNR